MAHAFLALGQVARAQEIAGTVVKGLEHRTAREPTPAAWWLCGAFHLVSAIAAARDNERQQAHEHLARAGEIAERRARTATISVPGPALPMWRSRAAGVAAELGDAGQASELARRVSPGPLSPERPARYDLGLARAHARRRQIGEALSCLEEAERLTPGQIRTHRVARAVARDLIQPSRPRPRAELRGLAERFGVLP